MRLISIASLVILCTISLRSEAVWLGAGILPDDSTTRSDSMFTVDEFLVKETDSSGRISYTIDFGDQKAGAEHNREFVEVLGNSITLNPESRRRIGQAIGTMGDICDLNTLSVKMYLAPIPRLAAKEINVADSRRIARFSIFDCIKPMPTDCVYHSFDNNDSGLELHGLINQIDECYFALIALRKEHPEAFAHVKPTHRTDPK